MNLSRGLNGSVVISRSINTYRENIMSSKIGKNIRARVSADGNKLSLTIRLNKKGEESKSGKSMVLASTGRMYYFGQDDPSELEGFGLSLNFFKMKKTKAKKRKSRKSDESSD